VNDLERLEQVRELRKMAKSLKRLPQLLEKYSRMRFRLIWLLRTEGVPRWMIPVITPRRINITTDILSIMEKKISDRGNLCQ
jgi:hypothetical protein